MRQRQSALIKKHNLRAGFWSFYYVDQWFIALIHNVRFFMSKIICWRRIRVTGCTSTLFLPKSSVALLFWCRDSTYSRADGEGEGRSSMLLLECRFWICVDTNNIESKSTAMTNTCLFTCTSAAAPKDQCCFTKSIHIQQVQPKHSAMNCKKGWGK